MSRVVHLHIHPRRTGVTRHVESMVRALDAEFKAAVLGGSVAGDLPRLSLAQLWRVVRSEPVVLHAHRNLEILLGLALRLLGRSVRLVATRHSATQPSRFTRFLFRRADLRVALTAEVQEVLGLAAEVVPHGIDLTQFSPPPDRATTFAALGLQGRAAAGVVGRLRASKGQGDFAEAWRALDATVAADWSPVLVGAVRARDQPFADQLRTTVPTLVFAGEVMDVRVWLQGLSIVVQPSLSEGFSLVVLEAMACGVCVVAARLPHFERGIIEDQRTGFLYPPGDVAALCTILDSLIKDPTRVAEVGARAAEHAQRSFGLEAEVSRLGTLYRGLLRGSR